MYRLEANAFFLTRLLFGGMRKTALFKQHSHISFDETRNLILERKSYVKKQKPQGIITDLLSFLVYSLE